MLFCFTSESMFASTNSNNINLTSLMGISSACDICWSVEGGWPLEKFLTSFVVIKSESCLLKAWLDERASGSYSYVSTF